ncbi:hypothetical protein Bca52824_026571 [Brassica carinata]|uniref:RNase H type-1 domain-containing protein n=1 Tax=Brassica carinata TaxID=52824 RepID=A0A8X7SI85_BRACI|nr:hypothetical protein Bca52824_026571 [Brassica carinata]
MEEAMVWLQLHGAISESSRDLQLTSGGSVGWKKPPLSFIKCNVGVSWSEVSKTCGAAWIVRDSAGTTLVHSRRSFSGVTTSLQADLIALSWSAEAMVDLKFRNVIFESFSDKFADLSRNPLSHPPSYHAIHSIIRLIHSLPGSNLHFVANTSNMAASRIAQSVTDDQCLCLQSYVARNGPRWLTAVLSEEAAAA